MRILSSQALRIAIAISWLPASIAGQQALPPVPDAPVSDPTAVPEAPSLRPGPERKPEKIVARFEAGKTYRFVNKTTVRMQVPAQGIREVSIEQQARFDVSERPDGKAGVTVKAITERLAIDLRSGERRIAFDSLKAEDRQTRIGQHFKASLNRWGDLVLNRDLRVVSAEVGGRAGVATPLPGLPQFGPDELQQLIASIPQGLPEDPVAPGDEWVLQGGRGVDDVGEVAFDITYRHMGEKDFESFPCVLIEFSGQLSGDVALPTRGGAFDGGKMDFRGTSLSGRILFDGEEKTVRSSEQTLSMLMELPGGTGSAPVQVPIEQRVELRLLHVIPTP